jgi:hypothetical protein
MVGQAEEICCCGWLERGAADPADPIVFDASLREFQLVCAGENLPVQNKVIRFCPFCGGRAPQSVRAEMLPSVPASERLRLLGLVRGVSSLEHAIELLGAPDSDDPHGSAGTRADGEFGTMRTLSYRRLSVHAEVLLIDRAGRVDVVIRPQRSPQGDPRPD